MSNPIRVAICIITFRRPEGLARLLQALKKLTFQTHPPDISIIVADNDAAGSAKPICERFQAEIRWPLSYAIEPQRGIAPARNRALQMVGDDVEWIAFIDDDEVPEPVWLENLLRAQNAYGGDIVVGPVLPEFEAPVSAWVERGRFFHRKRYPTGQRVPIANTGNVLFRSSILKSFPTPFEPRLGLIGGEDRHFFQRVRMAGYTIIWADDAVVHEWISADRASAKWLIKRRFRVGSSVSLIERDLTPTLAALIKRIIKALSSMGIGFLLLWGGIIGGRAVLLKAAMWFAYGLGMIAGLFGFSYREYLSAGEKPKSEAQEHDSA